MEATVCRPPELGTAELERWRSLQLAAPSLRHPFLSGEFAQAVGSVSRRARVAVVEDGADAVGFFAFDQHAMGAARPLAARLTYRQAFVHEPGLVWSWAEIARAARLPIIEFSGLTGEQARDLAADELVPSPIIDTSGGWDGYLADARRRRRIKNTMYLARKLEREVAPLELRHTPMHSSEFSHLVAWKSQQYRRSGWPDPFARRWVRDLLDLLAGGPRGLLEPVLSTLHAGDELVAADLSLVFDGVWAGWFSAYNPAFSSYSPGAICMLRTIEQACTDGIAYIDLAHGDETYKRSFKNAFLEVGTGRVESTSPRAIAYRAACAPGRATRSYILSRPRVRSFVRSSLRRVGSARIAATGVFFGGGLQ
ncbi:MAG TPA: GNAT family N-acetyltransferase [Acidimicrobiia bacterium]